MENVVNELLANIASMGPRPEGHGEGSDQAFYCFREGSFNGATSRRTWRADKDRHSIVFKLRASLRPRPDGHEKRESEVDIKIF